jgi:phosphoribosyl-ATP pyrophosphohydrolase
MEIDAIKRLIETDEKMRAEVQAQYQKRSDLKKKIEDQKKQISQDSWNAVNAQVASTKKELDQKIADDAAINQKYYEESLSDLQASYDKNKDTWKKEILDRIIHGE